MEQTVEAVAAIGTFLEEKDQISTSECIYTADDSALQHYYNPTPP
jgi:hypothetical protein